MTIILMKIPEHTKNHTDILQDIESLTEYEGVETQTLSQDDIKFIIREIDLTQEPRMYDDVILPYIEELITKLKSVTIEL